MTRWLHAWQQRPACTGWALWLWPTMMAWQSGKTQRAISGTPSRVRVMRAPACATRGLDVEGLLVWVLGGRCFGV